MWKITCTLKKYRKMKTERTRAQIWVRSARASFLLSPPPVQQWNARWMSSFAVVISLRTCEGIWGGWLGVTGDQWADERGVLLHFSAHLYCSHQASSFPHLCLCLPQSVLTHWAGCIWQFHTKPWCISFFLFVLGNEIVIDIVFVVVNTSGCQQY